MARGKRRARSAEEPRRAAAEAVAAPDEEGAPERAHAFETARDARLWTWIAVGFVAAGAVVRFADLGGKSLWFDEALSIFDSRSLERRFGSGYHPPLYYYLLHAWILVAGSGDVAVRLLSAAAGTLTLVPLLALARRLFSARAAAFAVAVLATSSLHVEYSQEARMYALATAFATLAVWCAAEAVAGDRASRAHAWAWAAATAAAALLAAATHYLALFLLAALGVGLLLGWPRTRALVARLALLALPAAAAAAAARVATGYLRQARVALEFVRTGEGVNQRLFGDLGPRLARFPVDFAVEILPGTSLKWLVVANYRLAAIILFDLVALAAFVALWRSGAERWKRALALTLALAPLPAIAAMLGAGQLRFFVVASPFVALALGAGLDAVRPRAAGTAGMAAILLLSALALSWYYAPGMDKQPWRWAAGVLAAETRAGDVVLVNEPHLRIALRRYYDPPPGVLLEGYPEVGGIRIGPEDLDRWLLPLVRDRDRVWFVRMAATASQSDPEGLGLKWLAANRRLVSRVREPGYNGDIEIFLFER
jgi:4-amino-4-deoxy-L-arabinose transferase-like glycosyltransferase